MLGLVGTTFSRGVGYLSPFVLVPLLLAHWGLGGYGGWLTLQAWASFISVATFGIVPTATSEMAMAFGRGDRGAVRTTFVSVSAAVAVFVPVIGLIAIGAFFLLWRDSADSMFGGIKLMSAVYLAVGSIYVSILTGLGLSCLSALGHYGLSNMIEACRRGVELMLLFVVVGWFNFEPGMAICVLPLTNVGAFVVSWVVLIIIAPWLRPCLKDMSLSPLRKLGGPLLGSFFLSAGYNQLIIQGPRLVIGATLGELYVSIYTIGNMWVRLPRQLIELVISNIQVEFSLMAGRGNAPDMRDMYKVAFVVTAIAGIAGTVTMILAAAPIIKIWTGGRVDVGLPLVVVISVGSFFDTISFSCLTVLIATNRVIIPALMLFVAGSGGLSIAYLMALKFGLLSCAVAMNCAIVGYSVALIVTATQMLEMSVLDLFMKPLSRIQIKRALAGSS